MNIMEPKLCVVDGCNDLRSRRNLMCVTHVHRKDRYGDPLYVPTRQFPGTPRITNPSYGTVHKRLFYDLGSASQHQCVDCGGQALHWSYDHSDLVPLCSPKGDYSTDQSKYQPRCALCHKVFDGYGSVAA